MRLDRDAALPGPSPLPGPRRLALACRAAVVVGGVGGATEGQGTAGSKPARPLRGEGILRARGSFRAHEHGERTLLGTACNFFLVYGLPSCTSSTCSNHRTDDLWDSASWRH